jgi:hypothetical protein
MLDLMVPIVKAYSTDKGFKVTELGVQVYGGYGYCRDYPMEQYLRDVKIASIYEGTNGIQALDLLGRKMRLKGGALFMQYVMELSQFVEANRSTEGLGDTIAVLGEAQQALGEVAFWLASLGKAGVRHALLQATPFLELFGDVAVGHQIAHQAVIAAGKLKERIGSATATAAQRAEDPEVAFYAGKLDSARFFASEVVMLVPAKARAIQRSSTAANDMVWA